MEVIWGGLSNFINLSFDWIISFIIVGVIGLLATIMMANLRIFGVRKAADYAMFNLIIIGEVVMVLILLGAFYVNLKSKPEIDFNEIIQPDTAWVQEDLPIYYLDGSKFMMIMANGKNHTLVYEAASAIREYHFSPNGEFILLVDDKELVSLERGTYEAQKIEVLDLPVNEKEKMKGSIDGIVWAPDSKKICYRVAKWSPFSSQDQWVVYDLSSKEKKRLHRAAERFSALFWGRDSERLYYVWFNALPESFANPYEVKTYEIPLSTLKPELVMKTFSKEPFLSDEHLELRKIEIYKSAVPLSFGRGGQQQYAQVTPHGEVVGIDDGGYLFYIHHHWWREQFLKWLRRVSETGLSKGIAQFMKGQRILKNIALYMTRWQVDTVEERTKLELDAYMRSVWRKRLYYIPRVSRDFWDPKQYSGHGGGKLLVQHIRWLPSARYIIMEHDFIGTLIMEPSTGQTGVLLNEKGNTFGWFSRVPL